MINLPKNLKSEIQQTKVNRLIEADKSYNEKVTESIQSAQTVENEEKAPQVETDHQVSVPEVVESVILLIETNEEVESLSETENASPKVEEGSELIPSSDVSITDQKTVSTSTREKKSRQPKMINNGSTAITDELDPKKTILEQRTGEEWFHWFNQAPFEDIVQEFIKQYPKKNENIKYEKEQRNILLSDELFIKIKQQLKKIDQMCEDVHESNADDAKAHSNRGWIGWYIENVLRAHFQMEPMRRGKN